ncbi:hypothetical protein Ancab_013732 [Ancistrocladus abbreviatus]
MGRLSLIPFYSISFPIARRKKRTNNIARYPCVDAVLLCLIVLAATFSSRIPDISIAQLPQELRTFSSLSYWVAWTKRQSKCDG